MSKTPVSQAEAKVTYWLAIDRPLSRSGTEGPLLILGHGYDDKRWQLVSAVTDDPLPPTRTVQWGALTGVSLAAPYQDGRFLLFVVGALRPFPTALTVLFERHLDGDGFLDPQDVVVVQDAVSRALEQGWTAGFAYTIQR